MDDLYSEQIAGEVISFIECRSSGNIDHRSNIICTDIGVNATFRTKISGRMPSSDILNNDDIVILDISEVGDEELGAHFDRFIVDVPSKYRIILDKHMLMRSNIREYILTGQRVYNIEGPIDQLIEQLRMDIIDFVVMKKELSRRDEIESKVVASSFSDKLSEIADSLDELRINSVAEYTDELRQISKLLSGGPDTDLHTNSSLRILIKDALIVISKIIDVVGNNKIANLALCGAAGYIVGLGGWPATIAYSVSLGAMQGKDAFIEAVRNLPLFVSSRETSSPAPKPKGRRKKATSPRSPRFES